MAAFGIERESIERAIEADPPELFEIWPENLESLRVFLALATSWSVAAGMSGIIYIGLAAGHVESELSMQGVEDRVKVRGDILVMERAALRVLNRRCEVERGTRWT